ncbi:amidase [Stella humosa]|uniref:Amidase n=1 Tax=Stella humosa TaxID=94 RepID=A0A3N1KVP8_9PROT|nr:amidase family protein [Stella humosa]ROP83327.1 amidase [Stella humosa]BBK29890.1 indoleacetamide hydrolase [Stella humosa]
MTAGSSDKLWKLDGVELAWLIRSRQVSAREVTQACLDRLDAVNPQINAVVLALHDEALAEADAADRAVARGDELGPLHGVPVTTKVNTDQRGCPTDNGIVAFKDLVATEDSPVVANLRKAGAVVIGRTNTPGFSMRWFTDNDLHGLTKNPWRGDITAGGSSGGAGSAIAAGIGPISQGNDIAGSIRYPAYCNGVTGIRPTFGRVPSFNGTAKGTRPISSQLMAVNGPLARRIRDLRVAFQALSAGDPRDPRWVGVPFAGPPVTRPIRVAMVVDPAGLGVHPAVADGIRRAGQVLADAGYVVEEVEPPRFGEAAQLWAAIGNDDVMAQLAPPAEQYGDQGIKTSVKLWMAQGQAETDPAVRFAAFRQALATREKILGEWQMFFEDRPIVLAPVSAEPPYPHDADLIGVEAMGRMFTAQRAQLAVSVLGLPGVSVPVGLHDGIPIGVQVVAGRYREDLCLDAAEIIEARCGLSTPIDPRA